MLRVLRCGLAFALIALAAGAGAQERPAVLVTPGSARSFRAAIQTFKDRSIEMSASVHIAKSNYGALGFRAWNFDTG